MDTVLRSDLAGIHHLAPIVHCFIIFVYLFIYLFIYLFNRSFLGVDIVAHQQLSRFSG